MTGGRGRARGAIVYLKSHGASAAILETAGFQPVRSNWTWQPLLPEAWLREHEKRQFRELFSVRKKEE
jgi:hypothetical protein